MAKEKNINITMDSIQRAGKTVSVLMDGESEIGSIEPADAKFAAYLSGNADPQLFKSEEEAVTYLLSAYHLHKH
ncbi:DUF2969 family protein [Lacticaseibacillus hulanensis]|uniref:DUF2969 family protein n=1 Tax=Lacticaseibacillus hulanensis TaxID=2493111 RepID=UPI000FDA525C|nr:DUF2969 family protein [Lacticaseibacillus hulanensis]